jgi:DNA mismatch endonuclease (patch repair protein)
MDKFSKEKRSDIMSHVRGKDTRPEEIVRKYLFSKGFRYRKNDKRYPGTPDIVLPKYKTIIFVNGCFWHQHPGCKAAHLPVSNHEYWKDKLQKNVERDRCVTKQLAEMGWTVIVVWECELSTKEKRKNRLEALEAEILNQA